MSLKVSDGSESDRVGAGTVGRGEDAEVAEGYRGGQNGPAQTRFVGELTALRKRSGLTLQDVSDWIRNRTGTRVPTSTISDWFSSAPTIPRSDEKFLLVIECLHAAVSEHWTAQAKSRWKRLRADAFAESRRLTPGGRGSRVAERGQAEPLIPIAEVPAPPGLARLPRRPEVFVGRSWELQRLDAALTGPEQVLVTAVHGLGGIGKTTLVARWVATRAHGFHPVWWITADSPTAVEQGLAALASALQPTLARDLGTEQLAERGLQWLATHTGWLLVLDNVNDPLDIDPVLARTHDAGGRVVVTSRLAIGWQQVSTVVSINVLTPAEAADLLAGIITGGRERDIDGTAELCAELGYLPLAVEQAAAFLAQSPSTVTPRVYLGMLRKYPAAMHARGGAATPPERTLARIWRVTLNHIATVEPFAVELLLTLAWWAPDTVLAIMLDELGDPPTVMAAVGVLTAYSMITTDPGTGAVSVHRMVQAVGRIPDSDDPHRPKTAVEAARNRASQALVRALPTTLTDPASWPAWRALLPHAEALADHSQPDTDTHTTATILHNTATFLTNQGLPSRAIPMHERALADCERMLGDDHPHTLASRSDLATACQAVGNLGRAIPLFEQTLTDCERVFGDDHLDTLASRNNLAAAYQAAGDLGRAIPLFERTLTQQERMLGDDHLNTMAILSNLAGGYQAAGDLGRAIPLFEQTLAKRERMLGDDHPDTLASRNNLAGAYQAVGDLRRAITLYERTLTQQESVLGDDHPDALCSRNNLAVVCQAAGDMGRAIPLFEQTLAKREHVLGNDHPATLISRNNLAGAYRTVGDLGRATELYERTLAERERILGDNHPDTLASLGNLAGACQTAGDLGRAIELFKRTLISCERVLDRDHPATLGARNNLAGAYRLAGDLGQAIPLFEKTLTERKRVLGDDHPDTMDSQNNPLTRQ